MEVRPLGDGEVFWYEQIKNNFMYPPTRIFASPPTATEGAQLPKPRPLRGVTFARKEILYLSSEESVGSSNEKLSSWSKVFSGVLRDLAKDPEEKPKKDVTKKKKSKSTAAASSKSSGSVGLRAPESDATPSSLHEVEEEEVEEEGVGWWREKDLAKKPLLRPPCEEGCCRQSYRQTGGLRSLYKFSLEALKKPEVKTKGPEAKKTNEPKLKKTKFTIIPPKGASEKEGKKRVAQKGISATAAGSDAGGFGVAGQKGDPKGIPRPRSPIGAEDTLGDIYYKTYTEERGDEKLDPVNRHRARNLKVYTAHTIANTSATGHQILRDWRTMHLEHASWEKYRERLSAEAREFEQMKHKFIEEKASFEKEKKSEE
ncbi:hypothetical protein Hanom_Chr02g00136251 [Helianthus anomalus]